MQFENIKREIYVNSVAEKGGAQGATSSHHNMNTLTERMDSNGNNILGSGGNGTFSSRVEGFQ